MARQARVTLVGVTQHVIQRGNNRQVIFHDDEDRWLFSAWLGQYARLHEVAIHAWVYMANHIHLLVTPRCDGGLPATMQAVGRKYVRYFNERHQRTGTLYEGRYKSCVVDNDQYLLACYRYIEMNPVRSRIVARPVEYAWSSYSYNAYGRRCGFLEPHATYIGLGRTPDERRASYRALFDQPLSDTVVEKIRGATYRGHALGGEAFKQAMERRVGSRLRPGQPGRPRRQ
jgi:putative transposase